MKQHDEIWVTSEEKTDFEVCRIKSGNPLPGWMKAEKRVIVLTEEELVELWRAAEHQGEEAQRKDIWDKLKTPDLNKYLESKGIKI
jgi:hypothetical protein